MGGGCEVERLKGETEGQGTGCSVGRDTRGGAGEAGALGRQSFPTLPSLWAGSLRPCRAMRFVEVSVRGRQACIFSSLCPFNKVVVATLLCPGLCPGLCPFNKVVVVGGCLQVLELGPELRVVLR